MNISDDKLEDLILALINEVDYDIMKDLDPETAEDPELAKERMDRLKKLLNARLVQFKDPTK